MNVPESEKNLSLAFDLIKIKLDSQNNAHNTLETKIGVLMAFVGVVIGTVIAVVAGADGRYPFGANLLTAGFLTVFWSLVLLVRASKTREYQDPPSTKTFYSPEALAKSNHDLKNQVVSDMVHSFKLNLQNHQNKAKLYDQAVMVFTVGLATLFLGLLLSATCPTRNRSRKPSSQYRPAKSLEMFSICR